MVKALNFDFPSLFITFIGCFGTSLTHNTFLINDVVVAICNYVMGSRDGTDW